MKIQVLHLDTYETELKPCENWSQKAINQCKQFINDKDILKVQYDIKEERNNYFFGNISIQALKTGAISIADFGIALVSINEAVQTEFQKGTRQFCFNIQTKTKMTTEN